MEFEIDVNIDITDNRAYITLAGMMDTFNTEKFLDALGNLPPEAKNIEIDMEKVTYISSYGLRALLRAMDVAAERSGVMKVVKNSEFVREILTTVGFHTLFSVE